MSGAKRLSPDEAARIQSLRRRMAPSSAVTKLAGRSMGLSRMHAETLSAPMSGSIRPATICITCGFTCKAMPALTSELLNNA